MQVYFVVFLALIFCATATAFKLKTHVYLMNKAMEDFLGDPCGQNCDEQFIKANVYACITCRMRHGGPFKMHWMVDNSEYKVPMGPEIYNQGTQAHEVFQMIRSHHREALRAGALGPDCFPDLFQGQMFVHVDRGAEVGITPDATFEQRQVKQFRSIDYGMYLLQEAHKFRGHEEEQWDPNQSMFVYKYPYDVKQEAIAFALGYLSHMAGDANMHAYINEWVGQPFNLFEGSGMFGPATEELQHMAIESLIDHSLGNIKPYDMRIRAPIQFLQHIYRTKPQIPRGGSVGEIGGPFYTTLVPFRDTLYKLSDHKEWGRSAALAGFVKYVDNILTLGMAGIVEDFEYYFMRRTVVVDALLDHWVHLSACIAQNMVYHSNMPSSKECQENSGKNTLIGSLYRWRYGRSSTSGKGKCVLKVDECHQHDFEGTQTERDVFEGELNDAAHAKSLHLSESAGSLTVNIKRIFEFLKVILKKFLNMNPLEEIKSVKKAFGFVEKYCKPIIDHGGCQKLCADATKNCNKLIELFGCFGCPRKKGKYSCSRSRKWKCAWKPHCFACAGKWLEVGTDLTCDALVDTAIPLCDLCTQNTLCDALDASRELIEGFGNQMQKIVERIVDPAIAKAKTKLQEMLLGPYREEFLEAYRIMRDDFDHNKPALFVNLVFLQKDMMASPNGQYLDNLLQSALDIGESVVDISAVVAKDVAKSVAYTVGKTVANARKALEVYLLITTPGALFDFIWENVVRVLTEVVTTLSFKPFADLKTSVGSWLDSFSFKDQDTNREYQTRFGKLLVLFDRIGIFSRIRGPALTQITEQMHMYPNPQGGWLVKDDPKEQPWPIFNAIQLTKMGFFGDSQLKKIQNLSGSRPYRSEVCNNYPHILCDSIQSLDDPSSVDHQSNSESYLARSYRGVTPWKHREWIPDPTSGSYKQEGTCYLYPTNFPMARTDDDCEFEYLPWFKLPDYCTRRCI